MLDWIWDQLTFPFVWKGLLAGLFLSAAFAPMSVFVIQRRLALAGDALAHGTLPGIFLAFALFGLSPIALALGGFISSLLIVALAALLSWRTLFRTDALLGGVYITFFSVGGVLVSSGASALNLQEFLIGTPLGIRNQMLILTGVIALISVTAMIFLYRPLVLQTQDPAFFSSLYRQGWWVSQGFMVLFVLVLITSVNIFGTLLSIALAILPPLAARCWLNSVPRIMGLSFGIGCAACIGGMFASLIATFAPTGPMMVLFAAGIWAISYLFGPFGLRLSFQASAQ